MSVDPGRLVGRRMIDLPLTITTAHPLHGISPGMPLELGGRRARVSRVDGPVITFRWVPRPWWRWLWDWCVVLAA